MSKNRKLGVPHFEAAKDRLIRASQFVGDSAAYRTFWGPMQRRDDRWWAYDIDIPTQTYTGYHEENNSFYFDPEFGGTIHHVWAYTKPTAWRPEHSLLVPPQVVHLSINVFKAYADQDTRASDLVPGSSITHFDAATAEQVRLVSVCREAAAMINALRPGKTWAQVIDYWEGSIDNGGTTVPNVQNNPFDLQVDGFGDLQNFGLFLPLPNPYVAPFYGTDFLQLYLGDHVFTPIFYGFDETVSQFTEQPKWLVMSDVLSKTIPSFHRYSARLYASDIGTSLATIADKNYTDAVATVNSFPPAPTENYSTTYADEPHFFHGEPVDTFEYPDGVIVYHWVDPAGGAVVIPPEFAPLNATSILPSLSVFDLVSQWSDQNGYDVGLGGIAGVMDATSIVAAVARHFGFDPQTGKDIPPV